MITDEKTSVKEYRERLIDMMVNVIYTEPKWWKRPDGKLISALIQKHSKELGLTVRMNIELKKGIVTSVEFKCNNILGEVLMFPELVSRVKEDYPKLI